MKGSRLTTRTERNQLARTFAKRTRTWGRKTLGVSCCPPGGRIKTPKWIP